MCSSTAASSNINISVELGNVFWWCFDVLLLMHFVCWILQTNTRGMRLSYHCICMLLPKLQNVWCLNFKFLSSVFPASRIIMAVALSSLLFFMQLSVSKLWIIVSSCFCLCWKDKSSLVLPAMRGIAKFKIENSTALTSRAALADVYYSLYLVSRPFPPLFTLLKDRTF